MTRKLNSLIDQLLSSEVQSFIEEHQQDDTNHLRLKYKTIFDIPANVVIDQISGRKKAKEKLPIWFGHKRVIYPPSLNLEQSSSEKTALQKMKVAKDLGKVSRGRSTLLDLTGGFGIDSFFLSKTCKTLYFVEPDGDLMEVAQHNHVALGVRNVYYYKTTAELFLDSYAPSMNIDLIYLDPSRRSKDGRKIFSLSQCEPDVVRLQPKIFQSTDRLLVKASPLLDIKQGLKELEYVKKIFVVSVHNECKELLFYCEKNFAEESVIEAINLEDKEYSFSLCFSEEKNAEVTYGDPMVYLYEPNASLLKSGAFKTIAARFKIQKLHPNTHLYTSDDLIDNFPGRIFKVESFVKPDTKELFNYFEEGQANILTRNYPLSVAELRKKSRLKEGGNKFLIGCSGIRRKFLIVARKLDSL